MHDFITKRPARVVFSAGCVSRFGVEEIGNLGVHRLIVIGSARSLSLEVFRNLRQKLAGKIVGEVNEVPFGIPQVALENALTKVQEECADCLLVVGGGTPLALAKALAGHIEERLVKIVSITTTYSGSEATAWYGVVKTSASGARMKVAVRDEKVLPSLVLYDSTLLQSLPYKTAVASGFNALAHVIEALWAPKCGPLSRLGALESLDAIYRSLPLLRSKDRAAQATDDLLYGAYLAGTVLDQEQMALQHRLVHVITSLFRLPHAETHMVVLPHVIRYNITALPSEVALTLCTDDVAGDFYDRQCDLVSIE
jgi:maleylacetate reductase